MNVVIRLPELWTPEQAEILYDFMNELQDAIWDHYGDQLYERWAQRDADDNTEAEEPTL